MPILAEVEPSSASDQALAKMLGTRGEPLFLADWDGALFLHFEADPALLQKQVAYPLDLWQGRAFVSLVAFTMRRLRFAQAPRTSEWLLRPIGTHPYLNARTYVRHRGEPGIFFLAEWMTNRLSQPLGRPLFGLPYRLGSASYEHDFETGQFHGEIVDGTGAALRYHATSAGLFKPCAGDDLTHFLIERYTCFTAWRGWRRCFHVWHPPWPVATAKAEVEDAGLLGLTGSWAESARFLGATASPGLPDVWMGRPHFCSSHSCHENQ